MAAQCASVVPSMERLGDLAPADPVRVHGAAPFAWCIKVLKALQAREILHGHDGPDLLAVTRQDHPLAPVHHMPTTSEIRSRMAETAIRRMDHSLQWAARAWTLATLVLYETSPAPA